MRHAGYHFQQNAVAFGVSLALVVRVDRIQAPGHMCNAVETRLVRALTVSSRLQELDGSVGIAGGASREGHHR